MTASVMMKVNEASERRFHESMTPQRMNRLLVAHSAAEDGFKYLIQRNGGRYSKTHNLMTLLNELRACDPSAAKWLDDAFDALTAFYGTDLSDPDHRHLASLSAYLEKVGDRRHFELMRYLELESSVYEPALQYIHIEFHHEILCALDEAIQPRYGTIGNRVESLLTREFLSGERLSSRGLAWCGVRGCVRALVRRAEFVRGSNAEAHRLPRRHR